MKAITDSAFLKTPAFLIDETICRSNIRRMAYKAKSNGLIFRPHFKTHQSVEVGKWFREEGVTAITVSSVSMARFFANAGWDDITIAFPLNIREIEDINELAGKIRLNVLVDMPEQAAALAKKLDYPAGFFIKIDVGYHRSGVLPENIARIDKIIKAAESEKLTFRGFLTHAGQTYQAGSKAAIQSVHEHASGILSGLEKAFHKKYPGIITSTGDTPSCSLAEDFTGIDEIRPGNFVFYDLMQYRIGSCSFNEIAAAVVCPVISVYTERNETLIYGGAVHLSKESVSNSDGSRNFGLIVPFVCGKWQIPEGDDYLISLSQEHGIIKTESFWAKSLKPGDLVAIIPVHSCLVADLLSGTSGRWDEGRMGRVKDGTGDGWDEGRMGMRDEWDGGRMGRVTDGTRDGWDEGRAPCLYKTCRRGKIHISYWLFLLILQKG